MVNLSDLNDEQLNRKIEGIAADVAEYQKVYDRAQALFLDEPTRAHDDNLKDAKRDLKWAEGQLRSFRAERDARRSK
ncbi:MAG TPA: hypothetical protein VIP46_05765 [Pyrinomonadaceae bacterium]